MWVWDLFFFCVHFTYNKKGTSDITIQKYLCNLFQKWGRKVQRIFVKKKQFIEKIKSLTLFKITHLHNYYISPLISEQLKHCNRFINCVPFNFSITRKRCRDRRQYRHAIEMMKKNLTSLISCSNSLCSPRIWSSWEKTLSVFSCSLKPLKTYRPWKKENI